MSKPNDFTLAERRHLEAAEGWLGLGNPAEADEELAQLRPSLASHPSVLPLRWQVYAEQKKWEAALDIAAALMKLAPESVFGWVHRSYCLHELGRTLEARENLLPVLEKFPDDALMRYNLACYECQLGHLDRAMDWLHKAFQLGDPNKFKSMALDDPDLGPLTKRIREL